MSGPITDRFIIGRQGYIRHTDIQGRTKGLHPATDVVDTEADPEACAQLVVDLACEDPGIIFTVFDSVSQDNIAVIMGNEPRETLLEETRQGIALLVAAGDAAEEAATAAEQTT